MIKKKFKSFSSKQLIKEILPGEHQQEERRWTGGGVAGGVYTHANQLASGHAAYHIYIGPTIINF